jgi:hypothetical protein
VEHPCYRCATAVEDGVAFCPQCSAPQIRVGGGASAETSAVSETPLGDPSSSSLSVLPAAPIDWPRALSSAARAGVIAAILMIIPLGASVGLGMLAAGFLSVLFYRRRVPHANPGPGTGARLGAVSGALAFVFFGLLTALFRAGSEFRSALGQAVEQAAARNSDPQAQQLFEYLKTPQGLDLVLIMGVIMMLIVFLMVSSLGGAIGAAMLHRKERL